MKRFFGVFQPKHEASSSSSTAGPAEPSLTAARAEPLKFAGALFGGDPLAKAVAATHTLAPKPFPKFSAAFQKALSSQASSGKRELKAYDSNVSEDVDMFEQFQAEMPARIPAEVVARGESVQFLADAHARAFGRLAGSAQHMANFPRRWRVGSLCSGSAMEGCCLDAIAVALRRSFGLDVEFQHTILSEISPKKQAFLQLVLGRGPGSPCLHPDCSVLHQGEAPCLNHTPEAQKPAKRRRVLQEDESHQHRCKVQSRDISVTGSSCKYFSKFNMNKKWGSPQEFLSRAGGGGSHQSWITYLAWICYLGSHKPAMFVYENVDSMVDGNDVADDKPSIGPEDKSILQVILDHVSERGYEAIPMLIGSETYGCCQRRHRVFIVGLLRNHKWWVGLKDYHAFDRVFQKAQQFLQCMKLDPPALHESLMAADDPYVRRELDRRLAVPMQATSSSQGWTQKHQNFCRLQGLRWPVHPSKQTLASEWFGTLTGREAGTLGLVQRLYGEEVVTDVTQDLSFGGRVTSWTRCNTVLPGTTYWIGGGLARIVTGYEALQRLQSWPLQTQPRVVETIEDSTLADLAGNAINGNVLVSIFAAVFFSVEWASEVTVREHAGRAAVLAALRKR